MAFCGGSASFPATMGGDDDVADAILEGLNAVQGTAYDTSEGSNVYLENAAYADAIAGIWETNQRIANQADPVRMTSMLSRWERIMRIVPAEGATMSERRRAVARRWARNGRLTTTQDLIDEIVGDVGAVFVGLECHTVATALTRWPPVFPDADCPWYSTISLVRIQLEPTTGMTLAEYKVAKGAVISILDARLPAWAKWQVWRVDSVTLAKGFYLDRRNLNNSVFSV